MSATINPRDLQYLQRNAKVCAMIMDRVAAELGIQLNNTYQAGYNNSPVYVTTMVKTLNKIVELKDKNSKMTTAQAMDIVVKTFTAPALNTIL